MHSDTVHILSIPQRTQRPTLLTHHDMDICYSNYCLLISACTERGGHARFPGNDRANYHYSGKRTELVWRPVYPTPQMRIQESFKVLSLLFNHGFSYSLQAISKEPNTEMLYAYLFASTTQLKIQKFSSHSHR